MARQTNTFISIIWSNWIYYTLWTLTTLVQCIIIALANQIACYIGFCYYVFLYCSLYILEQIHDVYISEIIRSHHISFCILLCEVCTVQIFIMFLSIDILVGFYGIPLYQNILQFSMLNFVFIDLWNTFFCFNLKIYTAYMNIKFLSYLVSRHILCDKYVRSACAIVMLVFICISVYAVTQIIQSNTKTGSQNLIWGPAEHKQLALFFADYLNSFFCIFLVWKTKICFIHR